MFNKLLRIAKLLALTALSTLLVIGCGGDGDGGAARVLDPISYSGSETPAAISLANTPILVTNVLFGGSTAADIPVAVTITESSAQPGENAISAERLTDVVHFGLASILGSTTQGYNMPAAETVNRTEPCTSGHVNIQGVLDDFTGTGTLTFDMYNCLLGDTFYDGMVHITIHHVDFYYETLDMTMDFVFMDMRSEPAFNVSTSGLIAVDETNSGYSYSEQLTLNHVDRDNYTGKMYKYENFVMTAYDEYSYPGYTMTFSGAPVARMYDSVQGSLAVESIVPFEFSSFSLMYPDVGGQLEFYGDQSGIQLGVESSRHVKLKLDLDGDADYEVVRYVLWSELENAGTLNLEDSDGDGMHDSWEESYGLDPSVDDADIDDDGDTVLNWDEYEQGYDPSDPFSRPM